MHEHNISIISLYYKLLFLKRFQSLDQKTRAALGKSLGIGTNALKKYLDPLLDSEWISKDKTVVSGELETRFFPLKEDPLQLFEGSHIELIKSLLKCMYSERDILGKADRLSPENITLLCLLLSRADTHGVSEDLSSSEFKNILGMTDAQLKSQIKKLRRLRAIKVVVPGRVFKNVIGRQNTIYQVNVDRLNRQFLEGGEPTVRHRTTIFGERPYALRINYRFDNKQHTPLLGSGVPHAQTLAFQKLVDFRLTQYASDLVNELLSGPDGIQQINANEDSFEVDVQMIQDGVEKHFPETIRKTAPKKKPVKVNKQSGNLKPVRKKASTEKNQPADLNALDSQLSNLHQQLVKLSVQLARMCVLKLRQLPSNSGVIKNVHMLPSNAPLSGDYLITYIVK
ncbi:hypothetical protein [Idiomarina sp.]|uniref:hypothetical protein n=1 Tax=Idiomarina sp. TaxID=1874361 RepID=UPI0025C68DC1|nr:hypothetical protein [Idiomarina sp.]